MTEEQKAAYIIAMAAGLNATIAGMQAENAWQTWQGNDPPYVEADFERAINASGCHHNAVLTLFQGIV